MPATVHPSGTTIYDPQTAYNSYVLFGAPDGHSHLIDLSGQEVHRWPHLGFPSELLDPAVTGGVRGRILVQIDNDPGAPEQSFGNIFNNRAIAELDWNGAVVWRWDGPGPGQPARQNHDWHRLANGNTLLLRTVKGAVPILDGIELADQEIVEVTPDGTVTWRWRVGEHLSEFGFDRTALALIRQGIGAGTGSHGFLTINNLQPLGPNRHHEAGDRRFHPDNLILDSREGNVIAIIDRRSGAIVWRLGPDFPEAEREIAAARILRHDLPRAVDQLSGQHDAHLIPQGLPGAGNLLVFDNQGAAGFPHARLGIFQGSRVLEIDPVSRQIVWQYTAEDSGLPAWSFTSSFISSARRLPNGNTLIDEGQNGRLFQVTPQGRIVWEYINPYVAEQTLGGSRRVRTNWVFRAQPVPYDWVPAGTPRSEQAITPPDSATFRIPTSISSRSSTVSLAKSTAKRSTAGKVKATIGKSTITKTKASRAKKSRKSTVSKSTKVKSRPEVKAKSATSIRPVSRLAAKKPAAKKPTAKKQVTKKVATKSTSARPRATK